MDTSSKNKNKLRWFIGIIVGILVTFGACIAMQFILAAKEAVGEVSWSGEYSYYGQKIFVKYINGMKIHYTTSSNKPNGFGITMGDETARVLAEYGEGLLFAGLFFCMFLLVWFLRSKRIWKHTENPHRRGIFYVAELLLFALCCLPMVHYEYSWYYDNISVWLRKSTYDVVGMIEHVWDLAAPIATLLCYFSLCLWFLRPLFKLGFKEYLKEYSFIYLIGSSCIKGWRKFKTTLAEADFGKKPVKLLRTAVLIQFGILLVCVCCWFIGIPLLIVYSFGLFFFLNRLYKKTESGYCAVLKEVEGIANGDLTGRTEGDFGMLRPLGTGLSKIKEGVRKAVEEGVKSERMKTELITNVSHDLKTPLTAILTYVELLKQEDITEEERASYIGTLQQKSNRLKVLIEDLFEVSRATSNTMELQKAEVDLVKMVKQAAVEHEELFAEATLTLRQTMPEEACMVYVDGQKTYRIFENLFSNICKYAMPESRVYVRVFEKLGWYYAELKNVSAMELTVDAEELTERFVRGDASRNTEGSGLGLAIAKSLTELQGGSFRIETDGDLFKVELGFPQLMYVEDREDEREYKTLQNLMGEEAGEEAQTIVENGAFAESQNAAVKCENETPDDREEGSTMEEQEEKGDLENTVIQEEEE